jgi:uncharacterized protein YqgC (DUF456 family)
MIEIGSNSRGQALALLVAQLLTYVLLVVQFVQEYLYVSKTGGDLGGVCNAFTGWSQPPFCVVPWWAIVLLSIANLSFALFISIRNSRKASWRVTIALLAIALLVTALVLVTAPIVYIEKVVD